MAKHRIELDQQTQQFFSHLWRGGNAAYWWYLDREKVWVDQDGVEQECKRTVWFPPEKAPTFVIPETTEHTYFGVHPTVRKGKQSQRAALGTIVAVNCLFGEFDGNKAFEELQAFDPQPSVIIESSPGKYHAYWLLRETFDIDSDAARHRAKQVQAAWVSITESDDKSKDITRVLRVPGTRNVKSDYAPDYPLVTFLHADFDCLYSFDELEAHCAVFIASAKATERPIPGGLALAAQHGDVIGHFNRHIPIRRALEQYGYRQQGSRFIRPGGKRALTVIDSHGNRSFHHSSDDTPMCDGYWHRPFDLFLHYEHGGDVKAAVKAAADLLGLKNERRNGHTPLPPGGSHRIDIQTGGITSEYPDAPPHPTDSPQASGAQTGGGGAGRERRDSTTGHRWGLRNRAALMSEDVPVDLVRGLFASHSFVLLLAEYGVGKTVVALDIAMTLSQHRNVIYVAAEGYYIFRPRVRAWELHHQRTTENLYWIDNAINLGDGVEVGDFIAYANALNPALIIVDTYSACVGAFGLDENRQMDSERVASQLKRIRDETGASVMAVHHHGKNAATGARGSVALPAAADVVYELEKDETLKLTCTKNRMGKPYDTRRFAIIEKPTDIVTPDDTTVTAPLLLPASQVSQRDAPLSDRDMTVLSELDSKMWQDGAKQSELARALGLDDKVVSRSLKRLLNKNMVWIGAARRFSISDTGRVFLASESHSDALTPPLHENDTLNWSINTKSLTPQCQHQEAILTPSDTGVTLKMTPENDSVTPSPHPIKGGEGVTVTTDSQPEPPESHNSLYPGFDAQTLQIIHKAENTDTLRIAGTPHGYRYSIDGVLIGPYYETIDELETAALTAFCAAPNGKDDYG